MLFSTVKTVIARISTRRLHYVQGQSLEKNVREYFYFIDHQGQLFLDDSKMKNFTSCFKAMFIVPMLQLHVGLKRYQYPHECGWMEDSVFLLVYGSGCEQGRSRTVRGVIQHHLRHIYISETHALPRSCPFLNERDIFHELEAHKIEESYAKWCCNYCGKAFYAETFLDNHMRAKHAKFLYNAPDAVCLADYCDIFRCDIISSRTQPSFWDTALCIEDDMSEMVEKCNRAFKGCLPHDNSSFTFAVVNRTKHLVCSSLTCNRYWYTGHVEQSQWWMLLKTFCTVFLIGTLIVYYFLAYQHFYSEPLFCERALPAPGKMYHSDLPPRRRRARRKQ